MGVVRSGNPSIDQRTMQKTKTSETHPIRVDFIRNEEFPILNRLGMTFAPGKKQSDAFTGVWDRNLRTDTERLFNEFSTGTLISLLEDGELEELSITNLAEECDRAMINVVRFPIRDVSVPESMDDFVLMIASAVDSLKHGETVVTHCKGGLGRAGLTAACLALASTDVEISASRAIDLVRRARPGTVETDAQEHFVHEFENLWREIAASRGVHYFLYWQERSVLDHSANDLPLDVVASNGLFGVEEGDTLWIITLTQERELFLAGRLVVGEIVEYEEAIRRMPNAGLWQSEYYAFPEPGTEELLRPVPILEIAGELRFEGENDRLMIVDGQINPQQLRRRRKLTPESVDLVTRVWEESAPIADPEELVVAWQEVVEAHPDDPDARYNLGVAFDEVGRSEEALREYQATIRLDPNCFPALYNLGNNFARLQQFDDAIEMFNRAILVDGEYAPAHFMLGVAYFESGRFDDAIVATQEGLEINPDDESACYNLAFWTFRQGDYRGALDRCEDVITRFPYYTSPHVLKGMCFRELGELDNEIQAYKDAVNIKVDGEGAFVINFTALFFLGAAWERKITGSDEGIEYVEADDHFDLQDPTHQFCFAMGHLAQGDREPADPSIEDLRVSARHLARRLERAMNYRN